MFVVENKLWMITDHSRVRRKIQTCASYCAAASSSTTRSVGLQISSFQICSFHLVVTAVWEQFLRGVSSNHTIMKLMSLISAASFFVKANASTFAGSYSWFVVNRGSKWAAESLEAETGRVVSTKAINISHMAVVEAVGHQIVFLCMEWFLQMFLFLW